jgi:hypothetical protein
LLSLDSGPLQSCRDIPPRVHPVAEGAIPTAEHGKSFGAKRGSRAYDGKAIGEYVGEYDGEVGEYDGEVGEYDGEVGEYDGEVGEYDGEVGEYDGEVGEYDGEVGIYDGEVGEYREVAVRSSPKDVGSCE